LPAPVLNEVSLLTKMSIVLWLNKS
jgi:hypothetical protein